VSRFNYFHGKKGENENIGPVVYKAKVPTSSAGWTQGEFFANLGHPQHDVGSPQRNAEQEYLLQGMGKGAMYEAAQIANANGVGISVRPTGVLAHMGIESGDPTKAQEFKNKTSKEVDFFLCDELDWGQIGTVVHYNPRVGWKSATDALAAKSWTYRFKKPPRTFTESEWTAKRQHVEKVRMPLLEKMNFKPRLRFWPKVEGDWTKLKDMFKDRVAEYHDEDFEYRRGHYVKYTDIVGVYVRVKVRGGINMVGDHDLFGFTEGKYGRLKLDTTLGHVQIALQKAQSFQAQHGGIWNWQPQKDSHRSIKTKIMGAHSAPNGDPLIYVLPEWQVHAAFYVPGKEKLKSAWEFPAAKQWLAGTHSGKSL